MADLGVALFARHDDRQAMHIAEAVAARGAVAHVVELHSLARGTSLVASAEGWRFDGLLLETCRSALLRQLPADSAIAGRADERLTAAEWWHRAQLARERGVVTRSCLTHLERRGVRLVNPTSSFAFDDKPVQLAALAEAGVPLPRTLLTNDPSAVEAFAAEVGEVVYKPVGGGAEAGLLDAAAKGRLDALASGPVLFQERLVGPDVRVTMVAGRVVSAVEIPTHELDYRSSAGYRAGQQAYVALTIDDELAVLCQTVARVCHHVLSGIDLKRTAAGWRVLEANSAPTYLDIELKTGHPITAALVDVLLGA